MRNTYKIKALICERSFILAALLFFVLAVSGTVFVSRTIISDLLDHERIDMVEQISSDADVLVAAIQREVIRTDLISQAVIAVAQREPDLSQSDYEKVVAPVAGDADYFRNVAVSRGYVVELVYPYEQNEAAVGLDYRDIPEQLRIVTSTIRSGVPSIVGPIELVQGGSALIRRTPFNTPADPSDGIEDAGLVSIVIDRDALMEQVMELGDFEGLRIALRNARGLDRGRLIWGDAEALSGDPVLRRIEFANGAWELAVTPSEGWPTSLAYADTIRRTVALIAFALAALGLTLWGLYRSKRIAEGQLASAIDSIEDGFALYGPDDRLVFANEKYRSFYELSAEAIEPGKSFEEILRAGLAAGQYPDAIGREEEWLAERLEAHRNPTGPIEQRLANGRWLKIAETRSIEGNTVGFRVDITELKEAKEQAEAANEAKNTFLNVISHELRTPLTSVIGYARFIENLRIFPSFQSMKKIAAANPDDSELNSSLDALEAEISSMANRICVSSDHLLNLINDVLDRAKLESGSFTIEPSTIELNMLVNSVISNLELKASEKGIELVNEVDFVTLTGDEVRLRQALLNVIGNAIKFTEEGGVYVSSRQDDDFVHVTVRDTGCGIAPEHQARIFEEFSQVDASVTRRNSGTGLGLAITQRILQLHGGDISVESTDGEGSVFTISLPKKCAAQRELVA